MPEHKCADGKAVGFKVQSWPALAAAALLAALIAPALHAPALSDEIFSLETAARPWPEMWRALEADVHPPLYYVLIKVWLAGAGPTLAALRAFSLLMACLAVVLAGFVLPRSEDGARWASWFLAADGIVLMMAGYGRMYTLLAVLCLLAWTGSDRWLRGGRAAWTWLAGASVAAGLCTHHFFGIFLAGLALWLFRVHGRSAVRLAVPWSAGAAAWAVVWGRPAWQQVTSRPDHLAWVPPVSFGSWALIVGTHLIFVLSVLPLALVLVVAGLARRRQRNGWPREARAAAITALLTLALPGLISIWKPLLNPRFTIIAAPFLAVALAPLGRWTTGVWPAAAMAAAGLWLWWPHDEPKCTSAEAAAVLARMATADDTVIFCRMTRKPIEYHWTTPLPRRRSFPAEIDLHPGYEGRQSEAQLQREAQALAASLRGRVFVVADTTRLASQLLLRTLEEAGWRPHDPILACARETRFTCYFDRLLVFDPPATMAGSPSGAPRGPGSPPPGRAARAYAPQ